MGLLHLRWQFKVWGLCFSPYHRVMHIQQHSQQFYKGSIMLWRNKTHLLVYYISRTNRSILSGKTAAGKYFRRGGKCRPQQREQEQNSVTGPIHWWHFFWQNEWIKKIVEGAFLLRFWVWVICAARQRLQKPQTQYCFDFRFQHIQIVRTITQKRQHSLSMCSLDVGELEPAMSRYRNNGWSIQQQFADKNNRS